MGNNLLFNDIITLVAEIYKEPDKFGNPKIETKETKLFCNVRGIKRSEFFSSGIAGYKLSFNVIVNEFEYNNEEKAIYKDKKYDIIKTYPLPNGVIELTLGEKAGNRK